jgi:hypothetical protein
MEDWLQVVWNRRPRVSLRKQGMLVLDASESHARCHIYDSWNEY